MILSDAYALGDFGWLYRVEGGERAAFRHIGLGIWSASEGSAIDTHPLGNRAGYATMPDDRFALEKGLIMRREKYITSLPGGYGPAYHPFRRAAKKSYERSARTLDYDEDALRALVVAEVGADLATLTEVLAQLQAGSSDG